MLTPPLLITQPIPMGLLSSGMLILIWTLLENVNLMSLEGIMIRCIYPTNSSIEVNKVGSRRSLQVSMLPLFDCGCRV